MRLPLVLNVLMGCFSIGLNLYFIYLTKRLVDMATGSVSVEGGTLIATGAIIIAVMLLRLAVNAYDTRLESITYSRLNFNIRQRLYSNLLQNRWMGKEKMHSGDTLNRLFSDVDQVTRMICQELPSMFTTLFQLVAAFIFLSSMDLRLALVLLLMTPVFLAFSKVFFRRIRTLTKDIRESESRVQSHIQESLQHKTVIQSMEVGARMENQLDDIQETEYGQVVRRTNLNVFARTLVSLAFSAGYVAALLWGVKGIYDGVLTFGVLTAFLQLVGQIQGPSVRLTHQIPGFIYATASIDRLAELEDAPKEEKGPSRMLAGIGGVRIENLTFRYPDGTEDVLHDFNYDFKPGTRTSIEGETGIGKSTLIRLMLSLLQPSSGQIFIYDDKQRLVSSALTRANLVYVPQGNSLFSGSIRDNLLLGNPEADEEQMWHVLDVAQAGFVRDLPQGLDTLCGEQGAGLSEGQAQRIAIARGLLRPGSIMLLDEFSSSLDPATESRLMENLCSDYKGKTMIFITHREKISRWCDAVLKLSEASSTCAPQGPSAQ
ncbi:MAG: ABC transporter ATP-binding protein [Bacteroidales bacterium]|nr:ABC transporter ATP-binding protein [Bacteroidales bacterium]